MVKGVIHQEDMILPNTCVPNMGLMKYIKQLLIDFGEKFRQHHNNRGRNTPLISMHRPRQKVNKEIMT